MLKCLYFAQYIKQQQKLTLFALFPAENREKNMKIFCFFHVSRSTLQHAMILNCHGTPHVHVACASACGGAMSLYIVRLKIYVNVAGKMVLNRLIMREFFRLIDGKNCFPSKTLFSLTSFPLLCPYRDHVSHPLSHTPTPTTAPSHRSASQGQLKCEKSQGIVLSTCHGK